MVIAEIIDYLVQNPSSLLILIVLVTFKGEIKRKFTGRPSLVSNTITIFIASASKWSTISSGVQVYSIIGLFVCFVAFITYMTNTRLPDEFYQISWGFYNSLFALLFPFIL
jgi:hypothetical protein